MGSGLSEVAGLRIHRLLHTQHCKKVTMKVTGVPGLEPKGAWSSGTNSAIVPFPEWSSLG